jgi:hypothetical protein
MTQMIFKGCHMTLKVCLSNWGSFSECLSSLFRACRVPVLFSKGTSMSICKNKRILMIKHDNMTQIIFKGCHMTLKVCLSNLGSFS